MVSMATPKDLARHILSDFLEPEAPMLIQRTTQRPRASPTHKIVNTIHQEVRMVLSLVFVHPMFRSALFTAFRRGPLYQVAVPAST